MADDIKPITGAAAAGAVPTELEKFKGVDGQLDVAKLSQGYLETQKMAHEATTKRSEAERAYAVLAEQIGGAAAAGAVGAGGRTREADDDGASEGEPLTRGEAKPVVQAFIELVHPEVAIDPATNAPKDQKFYDGLIGYVKTLPLSVKQAILAGDFSAQDWAIKQYKAVRGVSHAAGSSAGVGGSAGSEKPNFIEGGSPGGGAGKKQWTHEEIQQLARQNPGEYAKLADTEIAQAYDEGRVK